MIVPTNTSNEFMKGHQQQQQQVHFPTNLKDIACLLTSIAANNVVEKQHNTRTREGAINSYITVAILIPTDNSHSKAATSTIVVSSSQ